MQIITMVELAAAALAGWAVWKTLPRPPDRDWERLFKVSLSALSWGEAEAAGGTEAERTARWTADLERVVPYHPAGRDPETKLRAPALDTIATPALEGEQALVEALARQESPVARWRAMYVEDRRAMDALGEDPLLLGPAYDPGVVLGPDASWERVSAWDPAVGTALVRRLNHLVLVSVSCPLSAADLGGVAAGLHCVDLDEDWADGSPEASAARLLAACPEPHQRLGVLCTGPAVLPLLRAMRASPALRDRVLLVVSIGGEIQGNPEADKWLTEEFRHDRMEPELQRTTTFAAVVDVDPDDPLATSWGVQRFPDVPLAGGERRTIDTVDLGPLPIDRVPTARLARAMCLLIAFWVT